MEPLSLIVNPVAGGGRARRVAERARALLSRRFDVALHQTRGAGDAGAAATAALAAGAVRVIVCAGDGTINEVASVLAGSRVPLGILPVGRGNDLARALSLPRSVEGALAVAIEGAVRRIDLGTVNGRVFCTVAAAGFDAEVAHRVRTGRWHHAGRIGYAWGVLQSLASLQARPARLEGDFGVREGAYILAAVSNTGWYGGGIRISPGASPDDGLLDCCLVQRASRFRVLQIFPRAYRGTHVRAPEVEVLRSRSLRLTVAGDWPVITDGEPAGTTPATFEVRALALPVLVPAVT